MNLFDNSVKKYIEQKDFNRLNQLLAARPKLVDAGITIPFDFFCTTTAHLLHRICDGVFTGKISGSEALRFAQIFLNHGAEIDGDKNKGEGTPL